MYNIFPLLVETTSVGKVESLKDTNTLDLSSSGSTTYSNNNSTGNENCDTTSLPKIIQVHERNDISATPITFTFNLGDSGNWLCSKCNNNNTIGNARCAICGATLTHLSLRNEANQTDIKSGDIAIVENMYESRIKRAYNQEVQEFPRIRVEDEEGISVHSEGDTKEYSSVTSDSAQYHNDGNKKSIAVQFKYIESGNTQGDNFALDNSVGEILKQNSEADNKSQCSDVSEMVG